MVKKLSSTNRGCLEKRIEQRACQKIKSVWPTSLIRKMSPYGSNDWPDRMVILPDVPPFFIEFKKLGGKPSPGQRYLFDQLVKLGSHVYVCTSVEEAVEACDCERLRVM